MLAKATVATLGARLRSCVVDSGLVGDSILWIDLGDGYSDQARTIVWWPLFGGLFVAS